MPKENLDSSCKTQTDRFKEAARELGCDEDEAAFDDKLRALAKPKPRPSAKPKNEKTPE
ncbi:hypothetical protein AiwAL_19390 [Acidiphilium sp. AL]|uniref:hypothetical protein n=1 Tax=Acidiphilium sp. AL TaxID=2871704 RepID=UPI0021CB77C3|nr:hypothetical protein [Acidiphilium sp. AL]MCU4162213.1 hypothetical protein [Acidiphilium sp. AL]